MLTAVILAALLGPQPMRLDSAIYDGNRAGLLQSAPAECERDELEVPACVDSDDDDGET